jgi:L-lactate dehydrogenase complex protein LldG
MVAGTIQNREIFLNQVAHSLGRERRKAPIERPSWKYRPQDEVLKEATMDDLVNVLRDQCTRIHTSLVETDLNSLSSTLQNVVTQFGGGPIVTWKDKRFSEWGVSDLLNEEWPKQNMEVHQWDYSLGLENIDYAEKANAGITISEITLAESGTVVLFSDENKGRTVSFLPTSYIALVPKSSLVARMTQATLKMRELHQKTGHVPSCINFITGPSNSADIELNLVVGVHGPVRAAYILIEDL